MTAQSLTWVARRVDAGTLSQARTLVAALGLTVVADEPDKLMAMTERGDMLEYCGPSAEVPPYLFDGDTTVLGFEVGDVDAAGQALKDAGFESYGDPVDAGQVRYVHFRGPGGVTYGLIQPLPAAD